MQNQFLLLMDKLYDVLFYFDFRKPESQTEVIKQGKPIPSTVKMSNKGYSTGLKKEYRQGKKLQGKSGWPRYYPLSPIYLKVATYTY